MFYQPKTVASMVAISSQDDGSEYSLYSDLHKDAIGCRPGEAQWEAYHAMTPIERIVEHKRLAEWMAESERIDALANEVAMFRFAASMEYLVRRGECETRLEAFQMTVCRHMQRPYPNDHFPTWDEAMDTVKHYGWAFLAMDCKMSQKAGPALEALYKELLEDPA